VGESDDINHLHDLISELTQIVLDSRIEMFALQGVLIEHHGLSVAVLTEYREMARKRAEKFREANEPTTPQTQLEKLKRFQGPKQ
jgi:hypothetical protein